ncbi:hypothetical protein Dimus_029060, partial [Dionaea muscipula]
QSAITSTSWPGGQSATKSTVVVALKPPRRERAADERRANRPPSSLGRGPNRPPAAQISHRGEEEDFQPRRRSAQAQPSHLHRHRARSSRAGAQLLNTAGQAFISTTPPTTPQPRTEPPYEPSPPPHTTRPHRSPPSPSGQVCIIDHRSIQPHRADNHHWSTTSSAIAEPASIQLHLDPVPS